MCQKLVLPGIGVPLFAYGIMILLGFLAACFLARREAARRGLDQDKILDLGVFVVLSDVIGARVFYICQFYEEHFAGKPWLEYVAIWQGGLVFYGGAIVAFFTGGAYLWWHKLPVLTTLDTCAPFVPIGMAFGRIGCWLNGCCWGWRCSDSIPSILCRFPEGSPVYVHQAECGLVDSATRSLSVHPTQLYDSLHSFLIFGLLWWYLRRGPAQGATTALFVTAYGLGRFFVEVLRGDHIRTVTGLTVSQNLSVLMVLAGAAGLVAAGLNARREAAAAA